jgi:hypothetical protein
MDFQIIVEAFVCVNHFLNVKICQFYFLFGFVTGAGRPIVRIEEIVTLNKLRRTFFNP